MTKLLANPNVRLAGRAVAAALIAGIVQWHASSGTAPWGALAVGAGLAFCEVFTPLNGVVGFFKVAAKG